MSVHRGKADIAHGHMDFRVWTHSVTGYARCLRLELFYDPRRQQIFALQQLASQPNGSMRAFAFLEILDHSAASGQDLLKKGLISLVESPGEGVMITQLGRDACPAFAHSVMPRGLPKSVCGTFETCPPIVRMSVHRGRPEVAVVRPNRRERPCADIREGAATKARISECGPHSWYHRLPTHAPNAAPAQVR